MLKQNKNESKPQQQHEKSENVQPIMPGCNIYYMFLK